MEREKGKEIEKNRKENYKSGFKHTETFLLNFDSLSRYN